MNHYQRPCPRSAALRAVGRRKRLPHQFRVVTLLLCVSVFLWFPLIASNQTPANVAGKWTVTVRMPGHLVTEQWTIQQKGTTVAGTAKSDHGELPVSGTIEGVFFRVSVQDGQKEYRVRATVDGEAMDGSIALGAGDERLWFAKRAR